MSLKTLLILKIFIKLIIISFKINVLCNIQYNNLRLRPLRTMYLKVTKTSQII